MASSEADLGTHPQQVIHRALAARRFVDQHRSPEQAVLPVEIELDEAIGIPVGPEVERRGRVRPVVRLGQAAGEDLPAQVQVTDADEGFQGTGPPAAQATRASRAASPSPTS